MMTRVVFVREQGHMDAYPWSDDNTGSVFVGIQHMDVVVGLR